MRRCGVSEWARLAVVSGVRACADTTELLSRLGVRWACREPTEQGVVAHSVDLAMRTRGRVPGAGVELLCDKSEWMPRACREAIE